MRSEMSLTCTTAIIGVALAFGAISSAMADENAADCNGVDFDLKNPGAVAKITLAKPRVNFIKSAWEDSACPADTEACQAKAYLIPGNLVLVGKSKSSYTCVSIQALDDRKQRWTNGWLPSASLSPVARSPAPARSDWIGNWIHTGGEIDIAAGKSDDVNIHGEQVYPTAHDFHNGVVDAVAKPAKDILQFADDGRGPFDETGECLVRMQRFGELLVAEDNVQCGGALVTFTGFYRKK
jgi:hypothetical protein